MSIIAVGIDLAKNVFAVHGVNEDRQTRDGAAQAIDKLSNTGARSRAFAPQMASELPQESTRQPHDEGRIR